MLFDSLPIDRAPFIAMIPANEDVPGWRICEGNQLSNVCDYTVLDLACQLASMHCTKARQYSGRDRSTQRLSMFNDPLQGMER